MNIRMVFTTALAAATALALTAPVQASTVPIDYIFSGQSGASSWSGSMTLNFDSSQPFASAYTYNSFDLTLGGFGTFTVGGLPNDGLSYSSGSLYVIIASCCGASEQFGFFFDPSLTSQTPLFYSQFGELTPFTGVTLAQVNGSVPEPATWAMMLLGFGAVGASIRWRRRARPLAA